MLFHSLTFLVFFSFFIAGFLLLKGQARVLYAAVASHVFYAWWYPPYVVLLLAFTLFAYVAARLAPTLPRAAFVTLVALCLLPLCFFKYTHFVLANIAALAGREAPASAPLHLPLGISFITFTVLAYLVDVRRGVYAPEKRLDRVALYISFFPHLIAGPIMRPAELFPQFSHLRIKSKLVRLGVFLFSIGMLKKTLFADFLAPWVERAYGGETVPSLAASLIAFYAFPAQIYCDFSGYTDMALGLAFMLGVRLPLNFNRPYLATSIADFWHRWHITLSRWLRDYLYIPLGGNRHGPARTVLALMATMLIGGLWHGAAWTFVLWGAYHGVLLASGALLRGRNLGSFKMPDLVKRLVTFHLVAIGWILFRAHGGQELRHFFSGFQASGNSDAFLSAAPFALLLMVVFYMLHFFDRLSLICWGVRRWPAPVTYGSAAALIVICVALSVGNPSAFIYFDF